MNEGYHTIQDAETVLRAAGYELGSEFGWSQLDDFGVRWLARIQRSKLTGMLHIRVQNEEHMIKEVQAVTYLMPKDLRNRKRRLSGRAAKALRDVAELLHDMRELSEAIQEDLGQAVNRGDLTHQRALAERNKLAPLVNQSINLSAPLAGAVHILETFSEEIP